MACTRGPAICHERGSPLVLLKHSSEEAECLYGVASDTDALLNDSLAERLKCFEENQCVDQMLNFFVKPIDLINCYDEFGGWSSWNVDYR